MTRAHNPVSDDRATATRLLDAADEVFAASGFAGTTTAAIAERAGVTKALVHYYYGSKEALHQAVMDRYEAELGGPMLESLENDAPLDAILRAVRAYATFVAEHPRYLRLCLYNTLDRSRRLSDTPMFQRLVEVTTTALERGMAAGTIRPFDTRHLIVTIDAVCTHFFAHEATLADLWGDDYDRRRVVAEHLDHIVRLVEAAIRTAA